MKISIVVVAFLVYIPAYGSYVEIVKQIEILKKLIKASYKPFRNQEATIENVRISMKHYPQSDSSAKKAIYLHGVAYQLTPIGRCFLVNATTEQSLQINAAYEKALKLIQKEITEQMNKEMDEITSINSAFEYTQLN